MDLSSFQSEILSTLNDEGGDWTTSARVTKALNLGQDELGNLLSVEAIKDMCPGLIGGQSQLTTSGVNSYSLPTDYKRAYSVFVNGVEATFVRWPERALVDGSNVWTQATTSGPAWSLYGGNYYVWPIPTSAITITFTYIKEPTRLASGTDTTDFGVSFDEILIDFALSFLLKKQGTSLEGQESSTVDHRQRALDSVKVINAKYGGGT